MKCSVYYCYETGTWMLHSPQDGEDAYELPDELVERYTQAQQVMETLGDEVKDRVLRQGFKHWAFDLGDLQSKRKDSQDATGEGEET